MKRAMLFTVFTPTYNRRETVHRVWDSLRAQTCRDFEWVVVDDGSTDGGVALLRDYAARAGFPVRVARQAHGGKHMAWNRGVALARGDLFVPADSDDAFLPETLERFRELWFSIPERERPSFSGINVLCQDPGTGAVVGSPFPGSPMVSQNLELAYVHRVRGEKWGCIRTDALRDVPFPEDEALRGVCLAESYLWFTLARRYRVLCVNEPLRLYYRDAPNSIVERRARDGLAARSNGQAPARYFFKRWHLDTNLDYLRRAPWDLMKTLVDVWVTGLAARGSVRAVLRDAEGLTPLVLRLLFLPAGLAAYLYCHASRPRPAGSIGIAQKLLRALLRPRFVAGRILWRTGLGRAFTIDTGLYRMRFFPTAVSCAMWTDPGSRAGDERFFRRYLRPGDAVVDVGANVGTLTLTAAALVGEAGGVWSIEAHPQTFRFLQENIALNRFTNVTAVQAAAAERSSTLRFADGRLDDQNRVLGEGGSVEVPARRLDDLVPAMPVSLLKVDVEGFELFVFRGAATVLGRTDCVYFECAERAFRRYGYGVGDVVEVLARAGFRIFETRGDDLSPFVRPRGDHQNLVGIRPGSAGQRRLTTGADSGEIRAT